MIDEPPVDLTSSPSSAPGAPPSLSYETPASPPGKPRLRDLCWTFTEGMVVSSTIIGIWGVLGGWAGSSDGAKDWTDFILVPMVLSIFGVFQPACLAIVLRLRLAGAGR